MHDEIVLEVAEAAGRRLTRVMTEAFVELFPEGRKMPKVIKVTIGKTWGD